MYIQTSYLFPRTGDLFIENIANAVISVGMSAAGLIPI